MKTENIEAASAAMKNLKFLTERRRSIAESENFYLESLSSGVATTDEGFDGLRAALLAVMDAKIKKTIDDLTALGAEFNGDHGTGQQ